MDFPRQYSERWGTVYREEGICSFSLCGVLVEIVSKDVHSIKEIEHFFDSLPLAEPDAHVDNPRITLNLSSSDDAAADLPHHHSEPLLLYGLSLYEVDDMVWLTDGFSVFHLQSHLVSGQITFHSSFREKSLLAKQNFFLIGLTYLLAGLGLYGLHGAGLVKDGRGVLILGESGSGKTTTALNLVCQGWGYVSDDSLVLRRGSEKIEARCFRKKFYLDPALVSKFPEISCHLEGNSLGKNGKQFLNVDCVFPNRFSLCCCPDISLFVSIVQEVKSKVVSINQTTALINCMKQSESLFINQRALPDHIEILKQLTHQTTNYQLFLGQDLYEKPEKISLLLEEL